MPAYIAVPQRLPLCAAQQWECLPGCAAVQLCTKTADRLPESSTPQLHGCSLPGCAALAASLSVCGLHFCHGLQLHGLTLPVPGREAFCGQLLYL